MNYFLRALILSFITVQYTTSIAQVTHQNLFDTTSFMPEHYAQRIAQFKKEPVITGQIVFLGNSITEGANWSELLENKSVINRGIGGDITYGVLKRLDDIIIRKPSKLFILIGINDIAKDIPDEVIVDNIRKIIERIRSQTPSTKIYLQSILPVNPLHARFPQHYDKEHHIKHTNQLLQQLAQHSNIDFLNLFPLFLNNQQRMDQKFTYDGLHLNNNGYKVWATFLKESGALQNL
ncbi:GDSL-type esterase/lipase family protein [Chryseosolibacter indicus]|uniref:Sialate O-acetylesterase n=1 Tax=Chryseosolibacter indicus TaxID=2782351 RepID=A0ABS5VNR6_9BACT|nr:GDSL-type esterase/lipase family protein [Chryseosolibacter indicus]MBT1702409.1 sialate O-acetylesterase [Chryseosolibacter indicus]